MKVPRPPIFYCYAQALSNHDLVYLVIFYPGSTLNLKLVMPNCPIGSLDDGEQNLDAISFEGVYVGRTKKKRSSYARL